MIKMMILSMIITILIGLITKVILDKSKNENKITIFEFLITSLICCFLITPLVIKVGWEIAKNNKIQFYEYYNGWETNTEIYETVCHKNGSCRHTYDCDPHQVAYSCNCRQSCSGSGSRQSCSQSCDTCYRTEYDNCPYVDKEYDYSVNTTLGSYEIDTHRFPKNPQDHRWRESEDIPESVIENAGVGAPQFWIEVDNRIKDGKPGWMTKIYPYKNFIYASEKNILKQYSGEIQKYKTLGVLPSLSVGVRDFYYADKVYFVGFTTPDKNIWNERLGNLNSAVGSELQGDIHLVLVNSPKVTNPDEYVIALKSYWQNPIYFGKNSLPKNSIGVVLGTDGKTVTWARGFTGMPLGNEELVTDIYSLKGSDFNSMNILGNVKRVKGKGGYDTIHTLGLLENIIYGYKNKANKFKRVSMEKKDKWDNGSGFVYLMNEIEPDNSTMIGCLILSVILSIIGWVIVAMVDLDSIFNKKTLRRRW